MPGPVHDVVFRLLKLTMDVRRTEVTIVYVVKIFFWFRYLVLLCSPLCFVSDFGTSHQQRPATHSRYHDFVTSSLDIYLPST